MAPQRSGVVRSIGHHAGGEAYPELSTRLQYQRRRRLDRVLTARGSEAFHTPHWRAFEQRVWPLEARVAESSTFHDVRITRNVVPSTSSLREHASRRTSFLPGVSWGVSGGVAERTGQSNAQTFVVLYDPVKPRKWCSAARSQSLPTG